MARPMTAAFTGRLGRPLAVLIVVVLVAIGIGGLLAYGALADPNSDRVQIGDRDMVLVEIVGSRENAGALVCRGLDISSPETREQGYGQRPRGSKASCERQAGWYQDAVRADLLLIACYLVSLGGLCHLGRRLFHSRRARRVARAAAWAVLIAAVLDLAENVLLYIGLEGLPDKAGWVWRWAAAAAVTKFSLLLPALLVAVVAALVIAGRALAKPADFTWVTTRPEPLDVDSQSPGPEPAPGPGGANAEGPGLTVIPPSPVLDQDGDLWPRGAATLPTPASLGREPGDIGICLSGGGIRSGTVALASLDVLRREGVLGKARYLVSVSGGGYASGAWQLALQPHEPVLIDNEGKKARQDATVRAPATAYGPNSPELDHARRHGRYVADTTLEWLVALGTLLRGLLVSLALLAGLVTVLGIVLGRFYFAVPLMYVVDLPTTGKQPPDFPSLNTGVTTALLMLLAAGFVAWLVSVFFLTKDGISEWLRRRAQNVFEVTAVVVMLGVVVPAIVWAYVRFAWWIFEVKDVDATNLVVRGSTGTVVLAYVGALVSILWRSREKVGAVRKLFSKDGTTVQRRVPKGIVQRLVVWLVLLVLVAVYGALLTAVLWVSMKASTFNALTWPDGPPRQFWPQWYVVAVPVVFGLVAVFVDQTWMSLHAFYRRRLATAFAVRRKRRRDGVEYAAPYRFTEPTPLSTYGERVAGHPQVIFAAAANLSGFERTPPGRRATSYTFSHDWVGGPQVGYVRTDALTSDTIRTSLVRDFTVQSAMAVSGAAFASAMGRQARAFQTLLALSNARLGTWLPNPAWLSERKGADDWRQPRIPRIRRLNYLLREIAGSFDPADRFLLVTDGGHYENLGLVELLRHRCRTVYCIDAAGEAPPLATTLGEAMALAREELGVTITLDNPLDLVPGSGGSLSPEDPLAALSARLSKAVVITGTIKYAEPFKLEGESEESDLGRLIVAKTRLHQAMEADLLSYAQGHPTFPYDSTSDQWFDEGQFNAYYGLGRFMGEKAVEAEVALRHREEGRLRREQADLVRGQGALRRDEQVGP